MALCSETAGRLGRRGDGGAVEQRIRELGVRLLPDEPRERDGRPLCVEIPAPRKLDAVTTPAQRVTFLAAAYRAVLERRYQIRSRYFLSGSALEAHKDFRTLVKFGELFVEAQIAPLAWVVYSFDAWAQTPIGQQRRPPASRWIWSCKRWREQLDRCFEQAYVEPSLRTPPEAAALWSDWRCMWLELLGCAPETRAQIASIVEKWFPGETYERRLSAARAQTWQWQVRIEREVAEGGWPWL